MPAALIWNHRFDNTRGFPEWDRPIVWLISALRARGWNVYRHPEFSCTIDLPVMGDITAADLVVYTHTYATSVRGFNGPQWFLKSTGPTQFHTTIDTLGFGPYSSISYARPDFESVTTEECAAFFEHKVTNWIERKTSKWGEEIFGEPRITDHGFPLVVGQTLGDETVSSMWFGNYWAALHAVVDGLSKIEERVVVKLHPWTDGNNGFDEHGKPKAASSRELSKKLKKALEDISPNISVWYGMSSIHDFLARCKYAVLCNSTAGIETMLHQKPIISWGFPEYHWITYDLRHLCDLPRAVNLSWFDRQKSNKFICWYSERYAVYDLASTERRVGQLLEQIG